MAIKEFPGINVQTPWARLLLSGEKVIETRTYSIPEKYINRWMWLIETPGRSGDFKARVIGMIKFSSSKKYENELEWKKDRDWHLVEQTDPLFRWDDSKQKYGWIVSEVKKCRPFLAPNPRGIVYARPFSRELGI